MAIVDEGLLNSYLGRQIDSICSAKYVAENHCSHFVDHVLQLKVGLTCRAYASVRVQEIFHHCPTGVELNSCQLAYQTGLLFVTHVGNVDLSTMTIQNEPKKDIGIVFGNKVWHYSNTHHKVVNEIVDNFIYHYQGQNNGLWLCPLPQFADAHAF